METQNQSDKIKTLPDQEILSLIKEKSIHERTLTLEVVRLIREIDQRRLFLGLGLCSLFDFVTKELKYEEAAALRRIAAARLIREIPEIEQKVSDGNSV